MGYRGDSHTHETHGHGGTESKRKLGIVTGINALGFLVELIGGFVFGSVALLSDAVHMLFDASAYATAFAASYVAESFEGSDRWTFGFHRVETFSAVFNGVLLLPMAGWIMWEAYRRFLSPSVIDFWPTLLIAAGGLAVNAVSVWYLDDDGMSLNEKGAFYHLLGDAAGSVAVIVAVVVIEFTGAAFVDPIAAVLIALLVVWSAVKVLREGTSILLQKSAVDPEEVRSFASTIEGIEEVHDVRSWRVCSSVNVCTLHATISVKTLEEAEAVRERLDVALKDRFGFQHLTVQVETERSENSVEH